MIFHADFASGKTAKRAEDMVQRVTSRAILLLAFISVRVEDFQQLNLRVRSDQLYVFSNPL